VNLIADYTIYTVVTFLIVLPVLILVDRIIEEVWG